MNPTEMISTQPIQAERSVRREEFRTVTSCRAGKIVPIAYAPLLREDRVSRGKLRVKVDMQETVDTLMNAVNVTAHVHFVPFLAFERFEGSLDRLNRSYKGVPDKEGGDIVNFFGSDYVNTAGSPEVEVYDVMGIHVIEGTYVNSALLEAYNAVVNHRRKARSTKLPMRLPGNGDLAAAFWKNTAFRHVVPDFDQAMVDGEVELNLVGQLPLKGIGVPSFVTSGAPYSGPALDGSGNRTDWDAAATDMRFDLENGLPKVFAEMAETGVKLSLSNIEMAKKTAAFAALRKKYSGLDDDHIIDLLMEAVRVPDAQMAQPMLLDRKSTIIGYSKRYATDSGNLDQSVTVGETYLDLRFRTPPMNTGGIILVTLEIVPEVLFERQQDYFLANRDVEALPSFTRDYLDPEKVEVIKCKEVDIRHSTPDTTFGYAPLNSRWNRSIPRVGGKFKRTLGDPFDENRQRIWGVETVDPALTEDFYLVGDLHHNVFADTEADPFEIVAIGGAEIVGHTVFGKGLMENTNDYEDLKEIVDTGRVDQDA